MSELDYAAISGGTAQLNGHVFLYDEFGMIYVAIPKLAEDRLLPYQDSLPGSPGLRADRVGAA